MKIYTKQGDKGKTQLLGGAIVDKDHERIECYGSIDELNAYIGHIFDHKVPTQTKDILKIIKKFNFDVKISKIKYLEMIKKRYISILLKLSSREILEGINEINVKYKRILRFKDKLQCIIIKK